MLTAGILAVWAAVLAAWDWRRRRLPNWLLGCGLGVGAAHGVMYGYMPYGASIGDGIGTAVVVLFTFWPAYRAGWMGAGDVKLCATLGWLGGIKVLLPVLLIGTVLSGLLGAALLIPVLRRHLSNPNVELRLRHRIPYGTALGVAFIAWTTFGMQTYLNRLG